MDCVSVEMNAASVRDEFRMLLKRVTSESSFELFEKSSYNIGAKDKKHNNNSSQGEKKKNKKIIFSSRQTLLSYPSLFPERMITIKTNFLNSGSEYWLA